MKNLEIPVRNILLLGLILMVTWGCSHGRDVAKTTVATDASTEFSGFRLILVRHAEAFRNTPDRQSVPVSKLDTLTPRGIEQADTVGKFLKEHDVKVAKVVTAPTGRASQTAALIMKALNLQGEPVVDHAVNACLAGETSADKATRITGAITELEQEYKGKTVVIVTHQHLIHCVLDRAINNNERGNGKFFRSPPGSMTIIHINNDEWKVEKTMK